MQLATIECPLCGGKQDVKVDRAGETMACSLCGRTIQIPAADDLRGIFPPPPPPQPPPASPPPVQPPFSMGLRPPVPIELMSVDCPCGNRFQVPPAAAGLTLPCPACGQPVTIGAAAAESAPAAVDAASPTGSSPASPEVLLPPSVLPATDVSAPETPLLPPAVTPWMPPASAAAAPVTFGGESLLDPLRQAAARRARRRLVRNVVLWTIGMSALLATVVYLTR